MGNTRIGIILYPGVQMSAVLGLTDLLMIADRIARKGGEGASKLFVDHLRLDEKNRAIRTFGSTSDDLGKDNGTCDVLVLPSSLEPPLSSEAAATYTNWLRQRHAEGAVLVSVCVGAFLLAETGLLAGRKVTTHWSYADAFRERFPDIEVDTDRLLIDAGDIISAGGLMSWTDVGLKLVHRGLGPAVMFETARMLLIDPPGREQRYYSGFVPKLAHGDRAILKAQHFLQANEGRETRVAILAEQAGLEPRTFLRRFQKATGLTATDYAQRLRVVKAQELLQSGPHPIDRIAWEVGYADTGAFRKIFTRIVGLSPSEYRQRFHT